MKRKTLSSYGNKIIQKMRGGGGPQTVRGLVVDVRRRKTRNGNENTAKLRGKNKKM